MKFGLLRDLMHALMRGEIKFRIRILQRLVLRRLVLSLGAGWDFHFGIAHFDFMMGYQPTNPWIVGSNPQVTYGIKSKVASYQSANK